MTIPMASREPTTVMVASAMAPSAPPNWPNAIWIGEIDDAELTTGATFLINSEGFSHARLLVRHGSLARGFVQGRIEHGALDGTALLAAANRLPIIDQAASLDLQPPISVVICTRNRPEQLRGALASVLALQYPEFEIIVVDNNPADRRTRSLVDTVSDLRVRIVDASVQGLSRARNVGISAARNDIIAFTDDDVVVDKFWLQGIAVGFSNGADVGCVSGMVPSGEIVSVSQAYFDRRVAWARSCVAETFSVSEGRPAEPLFPFQVGRFGTGANFALRRDVAFELSGFDEALGIGSPTGGGEDIDMFVRVLLAGHRLAYEPSAIVWHRHRSDLASLEAQIRCYGTGLGAWMTKLVMNRRTAKMIVRRAIPGMRHAWRMTRVDMAADPAALDLDTLGKVELLAILAGPFALLRARLKGARIRPLKGITSSTAAIHVEATL